MIVVQWLTHPGGSEMIAVSYAVTLARLGQRVTVVVGEGSIHPMYSGRLEGEGIVTRPLPDAASDAGRLEALIRVVAELDPDLLHFVPVEALATAWLVRSGSGPPVVLTETTDASPAVWWLGEAEHAAWRQATGVAVMSEAAAANLRRASGRRGPIRVLPPMLTPPPGAWDPPFREIPTDAFGRIGCISRLSEEKGLEFLLSALAMLDAGAAGLDLHLFGDGQERARIEALARAFGVDHRLTLHRFVPDVFDAIASCSLMVLPSLTEGLPVSLIEIMATGRTFVASAVGGVPQLIGAADWAQLVPRGDSRAIADAIATATASPERLRSNGRQARRAFEECWTARRRAEELIGLYELCRTPTRR